MSYLSIKPQTNLDAFLRTRPADAIPDNVNAEVKMLTFGKKSGDARIFGSFSYILQKYAADIDATETYYLKNTKKNTIKKFEDALINMVVNIKTNKLHWFSEYKTGIDDRYDTKVIGNMSKGYFEVNQELPTIVLDMVKKKLFTKKEGELLTDAYFQALNDPYDSDAYDVIYNIFRERRVLRWTAQEILYRKKKLPAGKVITLRKALGMEGHVKIDEIILLNGRFIEVTNFVFLGYTDNNGNDIPINMPVIGYDIILEQLRTEIEKLYLSNFYYSPFKVVKRIFALARYIYVNKGLETYAKDLEKIIPFVSSDISALYQIKSELEAILRVFAVARTYPKVAIDNQINGLKIRMSNFVELTNETIGTFMMFIDAINKAKSKVEKEKYIKRLMSEIKYVINYMTIEYLTKIKFNPPPNYYYSHDRKYALIKRSPEDTPQDGPLIQAYKKLRV